MQRSTHTRTLLPGLRRKDSIRRPTRRFMCSDLCYLIPLGSSNSSSSSSRTLALEKALAIAFILLLNVFLFQQHVPSLTMTISSSGNGGEVRRYLRETGNSSSSSWYFTTTTTLPDNSTQRLRGRTWTEIVGLLSPTEEEDPIETELQNLLQEDEAFDEGQAEGTETETGESSSEQ